MMNEQYTLAEAKFEEWKKDEAFVEKVKAATTAEELSKVFAEKGEDLPVEEAQKVLDIAKNANNEELDADDLDNVSGGGFIGALCVVGIGATMLVGWIHVGKHILFSKKKKK